MSVPKKQKAESDSQVNTKIQQKFDLVFPNNEQASKSKIDDINLDSNGESTNEEKKMENGNSKKSPSAVDDFSIDLDFSMDDENTKTGIKYDTNKDANNESTESNEAKSKTNAGIDVPSADDGFSLDFDFDGTGEVDKTVQTQSIEHSDNIAEGTGGFDLDMDSDEFNESTQKTIIGQFDLSKISNETVPIPEMTNIHLSESSDTAIIPDVVSQLNSDTESHVDSTSDFSLDSPSGSLDDFNLNNAEDSSRTSVSSSDLMSSEEMKANIESTIKDIIRPQISNTNEFDLDELTKADHALDDLLDKTKMFSTTDQNSVFKIDPKSAKSSFEEFADQATDFNLDDNDFASNVGDPFEPMPYQNKSQNKVAQTKKSSSQEPNYEAVRPTAEQVQATNEDSIRNLSTLRALREEREDLVAQIKNLKSLNKEVEQDTLTLKANLDEAKIEITILRKRHMVEIEDLKYRLSLSDEKKLMAEEKARQADLRREKLEQKVRIDFNQVKQREKELESKLELLSMDVDSQVQSRDQKILELRRKIDALEFNMENASIKEQKSSDDKRKLEDRLNKIMKTLRNSIKNLEDDIDHVESDGGQMKEKY